jgi:predicted outer membrane protein
VAEAVPPAEAAEPLSDNQALDVLLAVNATGASAAAAPELVSVPELRRYLNVVRSDHQALAAELRIIADSLELSPEPHPVGDRIRTVASPIAVPADGSSDEAVLRQQVALHRAFLGALDSAVLRGQRTELLAQFAAAMRPTVSAHLLRAEQLERLLRQREPVVRPQPGSTGSGARPAPGTSPATVVPRPSVPETANAVRPDTLPDR